MSTANLDVLLKFPISTRSSTGIQLSSIGDCFKDMKLPKSVRSRIVGRNPFVQNVTQLREILKIDRKGCYLLSVVFQPNVSAVLYSRENVHYVNFWFVGNHKHLHSVWQAKASASNTSVSEEMLNNFLLHGRLIHFCLTPLLFMPRWVPSLIQL